MRSERWARHGTTRAGFRGLAAALMASVVVWGCDTPTRPGEAPAYDPTALVGGTLYRWPLGARISIFVHGGDGEGGVLPSAVEEGLAAWSGQWRYAELRPVLVPSPADADVVIQLDDEPPLVSVRGCGSPMVGGAGSTILCAAGDTARTLPLAGSGDGDAGQVKVLVTVSATTLDGGGERLRAVVAHELGHVLGIGGHSDRGGDLMYAAPTTATPTERDAATLRYVLHQPPGLLLRGAPSGPAR